jgi:hypothetical protein
MRKAPMEHVVFHPGPDGSPAFRRFGSLEDAVRFVEHLRNVEGVSEVSVHALSPVPVSFRAYYRVEVPADAPVAYDAPVEPVDVPAPAEPVLEQVMDAAPVEPALVEAAPVADASSSNGKRSLGFFAH